MRKVKLYIATSLNGMIAKADGDVSWLDAVPNPDSSDYGYFDFYKSVDTTIQGYSTFKHVHDMGIVNPYPDTKNYVFTRKKNLSQVEGFQFINEGHIALVQKLKKEPGKDIWLIGGGQLNTLFLKEKLLDEILMFIMPVIIPDGILLFENNTTEKSLHLKDTITYQSGVTCF